MKTSGATSIFFFSSRRRHTRYIGDWSSDVCSSDLRRLLGRDGERDRARPLRADGEPRRSEERRVGKECGTRRFPPRRIQKGGTQGHRKRTRRKRGQLGRQEYRRIGEGSRSEARSPL